LGGAAQDPADGAARAKVSAQETGPGRTADQPDEGLAKTPDEAVRTAFEFLQKQGNTRPAPLAGRPGREAGPVQVATAVVRATGPAAVNAMPAERTTDPVANGLAVRAALAAGASVSPGVADGGPPAPIDAGVRLPPGDPAPRALLEDQVVSAVLAGRSAGSQQVTIRLDPPELGSIRLSLRAEGGSIRGVMHVDNPETLRQLQGETASLIERLTQGGLQVRQMDFHLAGSGSDGSQTQWQFDGAGGGWQHFADGRGQDRKSVV
jgi:hypothetical protein